MNSFFHIIPEWLELLSLCFCTGTLVCRLWIVPGSAQADPSLHRALDIRLWRFLTVGLLVMALSSVGDLLVRAAEMSGQPLLAVFSVLPTVLLRTHLGHVWLIRFAAIVTSLVALALSGKRRESRPFMLLMLGLLIVVAATKSASGHAADAGDFSVAEIMDCLHLVAVSCWGGGLFALSVVVLPESIGEDQLHSAATAVIAGTFSRMAGGAVIIVMITALYNGWSTVGSVDALSTAPYGWIIMVKALLFLQLLCLGASNRYVRVPLLQQRAGLSPTGEASFWEKTSPLHAAPSRRLEVSFLRTVKIESFLVILLLLCSSLLRHEIPARHYLHLLRPPAPTAPGEMHHQH